MVNSRFRKGCLLIKGYLTAGLLCIASLVQAQFYPVQSTPQLVPPYSVYLSDYATPGNEKLRVILVQRDLTQPSYQLRLVMSVELNGKIIMRTSRTYNPPPISLNPGIPTVISGADLSPYLDSRNIDFVGYSKEQYERTKALPEGSYQIMFTAYDYRRQDVQVSNAGGAFYYLAKSEPPLINYPACGAKVPMRTPQQIVFSWLSRNTSSPNSAADTQYQLELFETRPAGRNPNDIVLSTQPVFKALLDVTQYVYSPADPLLLENMTYVWRVRAIDRNGKDAFRNNGYSEVCTFTYGGGDPGFDIGVVKNLQAQAETERMAKIWWEQGDFDGYRVNYRKTGTDYEWFTSNITTDQLKEDGKTDGEISLYDLEPDTEYETRVQGKKKGYFGGYTDVVKFRTPPHKVPQCGDQPATSENDLGKPFLTAIKGSVVEANGIEVTLLEIVRIGDGWYRGIGHMSIAHLAGAAFHVQFDRIYIRDDHKVVRGRMDVVTEGVAALVEQQMANATVKALQQIQQQNRDEWEGTVFYDKIISYDIAIDTITTEGIGYLNITDSDGNVTTNAEVTQILLASPDKAIIIQDKNGDQFVVQKDGDKTKVTKVEGGGLSPNNNVIVSDAVLDLLKKALKELRKDYSDSKIADLQKQLDNQESQLDKELAAQDARYNLNTTETSDETPGENLFFELSKEDVQDNGNSTARLYKNLELEVNKALVIKLIAQDGKNEQARKDMAADLKYSGKNIQVYIEEQKALKKSDDDIIVAIKASITEFVENTLKKYFVLK